MHNICYIHYPRIRVYSSFLIAVFRANCQSINKQADNTRLFYATTLCTISLRHVSDFSNAIMMQPMIKTNHHGTKLVLRLPMLIYNPPNVIWPHMKHALYSSQLAERFNTQGGCLHYLMSRHTFSSAPFEKVLAFYDEERPFRKGSASVLAGSDSRTLKF